MALVTEGTIIAISIPMITITIISSTIVKPFFLDLILFLLYIIIKKYTKSQGNYLSFPLFKSLMWHSRTF